MPGPRRIDEDDVCDIERAVFVFHRVIRRRGGWMHRIRKLDTPRADESHVQPQRRRSGATVEHENYGPVRAFGHIRADIAGREHARGALARRIENEMLGDDGVVSHALSGDGRLVMALESPGRRLCGQCRRRCRNSIGRQYQ